MFKLQSESLQKGVNTKLNLFVPNPKIKMLLCVFGVLLPLSLAYMAPPIDSYGTTSNPKIGPKGMPYNKTTSCKAFAKYARFNPHSVVGDKWFVFYYWAPYRSSMLYEFRIPSQKDMKYLHQRFDGHVPATFDWSSTLVFIRDLRTNRTRLLVEKGDRGQYWMYSIYKDIPKGKIVNFVDVRIKQTGDNKYIAIMYCKQHTAYIMSRINEVPLKNKIQDEASKLGFRGRKGKSYLYRGHEWMPIPEMEENDYWRQNHTIKRRFQWEG